MELKLQLYLLGTEGRSKDFRLAVREENYHGSRYSEIHRPQDYSCILCSENSIVVIGHGITTLHVPISEDWTAIRLKAT